MKVVKTLALARYHVVHYVFDSALKPSEPIAPGKAVLAPGHSASGYLEIHGLDNSARESLGKGKATLFLYQVITYSDWFQKPRKTTAFWQYYPGRGWLVTPKGNALE